MAPRIQARRNRPRAQPRTGLGRVPGALLRRAGAPAARARARGAACLAVRPSTCVHASSRARLRPHCAGSGTVAPRTRQRFVRAGLRGRRRPTRGAEVRAWREVPSAAPLLLCALRSAHKAQRLLSPRICGRSACAAAWRVAFARLGRGSEPFRRPAALSNLQGWFPRLMLTHAPLVCPAVRFSGLSVRAAAARVRRAAQPPSDARQLAAELLSAPHSAPQPCVAARMSLGRLQRLLHASSRAAGPPR
jgi:hypothetical protein